MRRIRGEKKNRFVRFEFVKKKKRSRGCGGRLSDTTFAAEEDVTDERHFSRKGAKTQTKLKCLCVFAPLREKSCSVIRDRRRPFQSRDSMSRQCESPRA